ncbi:YraN family protein [Ferrovibrio sp.]|uniref:YraN family protein n=1 Tax=Ferrovibrio sp. TaxID=1917215 RepID=UPI001B3D3AF5|nr:YraN family protein [Ferrovibrio sp.]MBP7062789.1 YraN family protein [Ferrovibrio sp.]
MDRHKRQRHQRSGRQAEAMAALWLRLKGYTILARNFRHGSGEVDLLARRGQVLAAVEVKWRPDHDQAAAAVSPRQKYRIQRAASVFWAQLPDHDRVALRFDALLLAPWRLPHHIRDAWRPEL